MLSRQKLVRFNVINQRTGFWDAHVLHMHVQICRLNYICAVLQCLEFQSTCYSKFKYKFQVLKIVLKLWISWNKNWFLIFHLCMIISPQYYQTWNHEKKIPLNIYIFSKNSVINFLKTYHIIFKKIVQIIHEAKSLGSCWFIISNWCFFRWFHNFFLKQL